MAFDSFEAAETLGYLRGKVERLELENIFLKDVIRANQSIFPVTPSAIKIDPLFPKGIPPVSCSA